MGDVKKKEGAGALFDSGYELGTEKVKGDED